MSQVMGVSVTDLQIASVIMEVATGNVLARNVVELDGDSQAAVFDAISQLVESVPFEVDSVTIACAQRRMQVALHNTFTSGESDQPSWFKRTIVTDTPFAFANVAAAQSDQRGVVVVIDLAADAVPFNELSIAAVDTEAATVVGAVQLPSGGVRQPVTEISGAAAVAAAFDLLPRTGAGRSGVFVVGPGGDVSGVGPSLEYETQLPVQIAPEPTFSAAHGAALHGRSRGTAAAGQSRWFILIGAAVGAAVLAGVVAAAILLSGGESNDDPTPTGASVSATTTTTTPEPTTTTVSRKRTPTMTTQDQQVAPPPPPPASTVTVTQTPSTIIQTRTITPTTTTTRPTTTTTTTTTPATTTTPSTTTTSPRPAG